MSYKKKVVSQSVLKAKRRYSGMEKIDTDKGKVINYGSDENPLTKDVIKTKIVVVETAMNLYNQVLEKADEVSNALAAAEADLDDSYSLVLSGAISKFTKNGDEIETLGGTRKSDRKHRVSKPKTKPS